MTAWRDPPSTVVITGGSITGVSGVPYLLAQSGAAVNTPADTTEDILATITIAAGILGTAGMLLVETVWTLTNSGNAKGMRIRLGGIGGTAYMAAVGFTNQLTLMTRTLIWNRAAANSQVGCSPYMSTGAGTFFDTAPTTSAIDTSASTTLVITGQKATSGETLTLESYTVSLLK